MQQFTSTTLPLPTAAPSRIGLMAGWGRYPVLVVEALRRQGSEVYCLGVAGLADPKLAEVCDHFQWSGLGRFGAAVRYFQRHGVTDAVMTVAPAAFTLVDSEIVAACSAAMRWARSSAVTNS